MENFETILNSEHMRSLLHPATTIRAQRDEVDIRLLLYIIFFSFLNFNAPFSHNFNDIILSNSSSMFKIILYFVCNKFSSPYY